MKGVLLIHVWLMALAMTSFVTSREPEIKDLSGTIPATVDTDSIRVSSPVYLSIYHGQTWKPADTGLPAGESINALIVHNNLVFGATNSHGVWVMDKNGWSIQSRGLPKGARVISLMSNNNILYAGLYHGGLYFSIDDGYTWIKSANEPTANVRALGTFNDAIYAGTDNGIYRVNIRPGTWDLLLGGQQINAFAADDEYVYGGTSKGVVRSSGSGWTTIYKGGAVSTIALNKNEISIMDYSENVFRSFRGEPVFIRENIYLPHTHYFRLTPSSRKLIGNEWTDMSLLKGPNHGALPNALPLNLLIRTPFGLLAASSKPLGGC